MKELLQEIKMLQGVLGVFVFAEKTGVVARDVPPSFRDPALVRMGQFTQMFFANRVAIQQRFTSFELKNDESLLLLKKIDKNAFLVTICEPTVSMPLVNMTTSMLLAELKAAAMVANNGGASAGQGAPTQEDKAAAPSAPPAPVAAPPPPPSAPPAPAAAPPPPPTTNSCRLRRC